MLFSILLGDCHLLQLHFLEDNWSWRCNWLHVSHLIIYIYFSFSTSGWGQLGLCSKKGHQRRGGHWNQEKLTSHWLVFLLLRTPYSCLQASFLGWFLVQAMSIQVQASLTAYLKMTTRCNAHECTFKDVNVFGHPAGFRLSVLGMSRLNSLFLVHLLLIIFCLHEKSKSYAIHEIGVTQATKKRKTKLVIVMHSILTTENCHVMVKCYLSWNKLCFLFQEIVKKERKEKRTHMVFSVFWGSGWMKRDIHMVIGANLILKTSNSPIFHLLLFFFFGFSLFLFKCIFRLTWW